MEVRRTMKYFLELMCASTKKNKIKMLCSILEFKSTETLNDEYGQPKMTNSCPNSGFRSLSHYVKASVELTKMDLVNEVCLVLLYLDDVNKETNIDIFDNVQINRNGVALLRIKCDGHIGKSVVISIDRYGKELEKLLNLSKQSYLQFNNMSHLSILFIMWFVIVVFLNKISNKK